MSTSRFALGAILCALLILYASTIIGPVGPHFVALDPSEALSRLANIPYVVNGSDQRSDWMGNLGMLVPLGFLVAGCFSSGRRLSIPAAIGAFILCLAFILAIKYAQLFFPPRTVTLNYVIAQSLGAAAGILMRGVMRTALEELIHGAGRPENLLLFLRIYAALVILFILTPLDFALNVEDLTAQLDKIPASFTAMSGEGRPFVVRAALLAASVMTMIPIGAMLAFLKSGRVYVGRSIGAVAWIGFCAMLVVYGLTTLVISGSASLPAILFRTAGIVVGAWLMHWLTRRNPDRIGRLLAGVVLWVVPFYLVGLAATNGLLSAHWTTPDDAAGEFYDLGLLPLFNYYIVSKAQAAKDIVGHVIMYAPIGVMVWLRTPRDDSKTTAFVLAAFLSLLVEAGRFLRPGLVPDINAIPLAGIAAWAAAAVMPALWRMLEAVAIGSPSPIPLQSRRGGVRAPVPAWRDRAGARRTDRREQGTPIGDVEDY